MIAEFKKDLAKVVSLKELDSLEHIYLGSKGLLTKTLRNLGSLPIDKRKEKGKELNTQKQEIISLLEDKRKLLSESTFSTSLETDAETLDFTSPKLGHIHPITSTVRMMNKVFSDMGYSIMEGPEIETDAYNFLRLNVPLDHPARDMQDTIYIEEPNILLRTQTSSIESHILEEYKPPIKVVIPGIAYRNEKVNKSNHFIFLQYQGVVVLEKVSLKDLFGTFTYLFKTIYGEDVVVRYRSKYYPEVEPGVGCDMQCFNCKGNGCPVCKYVGWMEMGGAGIIHPLVLSMAGIDTNKWMGFAFGLGLARWVMAKYNIKDIRTLMGGTIGYKYYLHESTL